MVVLQKAILGPEHLAIGATRQFVGGQLSPRPATVAIGAYSKDSGFYLLSSDGDDAKMADTFHGSIGEVQNPSAF